MKKTNYALYEEDIMRLRKDGYNYPAIAEWLAINKKVVPSVNGIRNFVFKVELREKAGK